MMFHVYIVIKRFDQTYYGHKLGLAINDKKEEYERLQRTETLGGVG